MGEIQAISLLDGTFHIPGGMHGNLANIGGGSIDVVRYISEEINKSESTSFVITNIFLYYDAMDRNSNRKFCSYLFLTPSCGNHEYYIVQRVGSQLK
jgi:hypothetical protein